MLNVLSWNCRANGQQRKSKWTKSKSWRLHAWFCRWLTSSCAHTLFGHIKYMSVCQKRNDCRLACIGVRCWHSGKSAHFSWCSIFMFGSVVCCMGIGRNEARQGRCFRVAWDRDIDRCMQSLASVRRMQSVQCNKNSAAMRKKTCTSSLNEWRPFSKDAAIYEQIYFIAVHSKHSAYLVVAVDNTLSSHISNQFCSLNKMQRTEFPTVIFCVICDDFCNYSSNHSSDINWMEQQQQNTVGSCLCCAVSRIAEKEKRIHRQWNCHLASKHTATAHRSIYLWLGSIGRPLPAILFILFSFFSWLFQWILNGFPIRCVWSALHEHISQLTIRAER